MILLYFAYSGVLVAAGMVAVRYGLRGLGTAARLGRAPTTPLSRLLEAGPAEVRGVIEPREHDQEVLKSGAGRRCLFIHTVVLRREQESWQVISHRTASRPAVLVDGASRLELDWAWAEVMAEKWTATVGPMRYEQRIVGEGDRVLALGHYRPAEGSFRQRPHGPRLTGEEAEPMLVAVERSNASAIWGSGWRAGFTVLWGLFAVAVGVTALAVRLAG
ncbi:MAG: hypothetical protein AAGA56_06875 [Myxococcota bacterium]